MNNNNKEDEYYKSVGIDTEAGAFKRYKKAGLMKDVDEAFIEEVKQYWRKNYNVDINPTLHIAFMNLTGKKEVRVVPPRIVRNQMVPVFNDQKMTGAYRDKNIYDKLLPSDRAVETVVKSVRGVYFDTENNILERNKMHSKLLTYKSDLIVKPSKTNNGININKLNYKQNDLFLKDEKVTPELLEGIYGDNFAVQKVLQQHSIMAKPHPSSVNTLRMVTLRLGNDIHYLLTFARFGANNGVQDNAGTGGLCLGVTDEGAFLEKAIDENCVVYEEHPTTGFRFKDMESIPNFDEFKQYVKNMHKEILHHDFVSWDIVVGADGSPVFLEANFSGATWLYQLATEKPLFGDFTEEVLNYVNHKRNDLKSPRRKRSDGSKVNNISNKELNASRDAKVAKTVGSDFLVGFMERSNKPTKLAKTTSLMCNNFGIELIRLTPWDVDRTNGTVTGKIYRKGKWVSVNRKLPPLIDVASKCYKPDTEEIMQYLRENTVLTFDKKNTPSKKKLQEELAADPKFSHLVIPTEMLKNVETLKTFVDEHSTIVLKPLKGRRGRGVYILKKQDDKYILGYKQEEKVLDEDELEKHYEDLWKGKEYLLQKNINSRTKFGDPFDCRVHAHKNGEGEWEVAKIYVKMGIGQKVMSNANDGGGFNGIKSFLNAHFKEDQDKIKAQLNKLGRKLPYKIEEIKQTPTMELGFDVGIDDDGSLYLFEANNGAATEMLLAEAALLRAEYYQHLKETHPKLQTRKVENTKKKTQKSQRNEDLKLKKQIQQLQNEKERLIKEKDRFEKKYNDIMKSNSWRITSPIRKASSLIKKK